MPATLGRRHNAAFTKLIPRVDGEYLLSCAVLLRQSERRVFAKRFFHFIQLILELLASGEFKELVVV